MEQKHIFYMKAQAAACGLSEKGVEFYAPERKNH